MLVSAPHTPIAATGFPLSATLTLSMCLLCCCCAGSCVVVDELVSTDDLQEAIEALEGVQSTDIHAFNKL